MVFVKFPEVLCTELREYLMHEIVSTLQYNSNNNFMI